MSTTWFKRSGCTCSRCIPAGGIPQCPECRSSVCTRALSHGYLCIRKAQISKNPANRLGGMTQQDLAAWTPRVRK